MYTFIHKAKLTLRPHLNMENGVLIIALFVALSFLWTTMQALQRNYQLQQQVDVMEQEVALLDLENQTLEFQKDYYSSAEYLELSARQRLNKAAPGEKVIILPPTSEVDAATGNPPTFATTSDNRTNFERWIHFFFGSQRSQNG